MSTLKSRWIWLVAAVLVVVCGAAAALLIVRATHHDRPRDDCAVVADMMNQWNSMAAATKKALETEPGERVDFLAIADSQAAMADKLRTSAQEVSSPTIKENLTKWAEGAAMVAQSQRDAASRPPQGPSGTFDPTFVQGSQTAFLASNELQRSCPAAPAPKAAK